MLYKVFVCLSLADSAIKSSDRGDHRSTDGWLTKPIATHLAGRQDTAIYK